MKKKARQAIIIIYYNNKRLLFQHTFRLCTTIVMSWVLLILNIVKASQFNQGTSQCSTNPQVGCSSMGVTISRWQYFKITANTTLSSNSARTFPGHPRKPYLWHIKGGDDGEVTKIGRYPNGMNFGSKFEFPSNLSGINSSGLSQYLGETNVYHKFSMTLVCNGNYQ